MNIKELFKFTSLPVIFASLCCLSPVILVMLGVASVSYAASLADLFYGQYKWVFRVGGLIALLVSFYFYITRTVGICSADEAVKRRNEIINKAMAFLVMGVLGYIFFLYVVVHYIGVFLDIWK